MTGSDGAPQATPQWLDWLRGSLLCTNLQTRTRTSAPGAAAAAQGAPSNVLICGSPLTMPVLNDLPPGNPIRGKFIDAGAFS
jgi:hypothetical protein